MDFTQKIDYSSISSYIDCPRKFFFQYMLHLRHTSSNLDLVFGSCWHYGLECAYKQLMIDPDTDPSDLIKISSKGFLALWEIEGTSFNEELSFPKSPGNALNMYHKYFTSVYTPDKNVKIIGVETPFVISLGDGLPYYTGRLDLTSIKNDDSVIITDHKTAKYVNETTLAGYDSSFQTDGYLAAGYLYYDKLPTIIYSVAQVAKTKNDFFNHTVMKSKSLIDRSLHDISFWVRRLLDDIVKYKIEKDYGEGETTDRNYIQKSFHRAPGYACTQYFRKCSYFDICHFRNNAITYANKTPQGYIVYEWDPDKHNDEMKSKLEK